VNALARFLVLLVPYFAFVVTSLVIGAAFVVPESVFGTVGGTGLAVVVLVAAGSLAAIWRTGRSLVAIGKRVTREC
jgi:hypothetical protein